jgi:hypothetical protein
LTPWLLYLLDTFKTRFRYLDDTGSDTCFTPDGNFGALTGLRVLDFGQYIAGPLAAMLLNDQGADVIHVDPPGGPRSNTPANAYSNRNKRSVVLDLDLSGFTTGGPNASEPRGAR